MLSNLPVLLKTGFVYFVVTVSIYMYMLVTSVFSLLGKVVCFRTIFIKLQAT